MAINPSGTVGYRAATSSIETLDLTTFAKTGSLALGDTAGVRISPGVGHGIGRMAISGDGIVNVPGTTGTGVFAVATVNVGAGGQITASADTGGASLPVTLSVCQTDPGTGACLSPPSPSVTVQIDSGDTPTFGVFVRGNGSVAFDPANNRLFVRFRDTLSVARGASSVAVRTQ